MSASSLLQKDTAGVATISDYFNGAGGGGVTVSAGAGIGVVEAPAGTFTVTADVQDVQAGGGIGVVEAPAGTFTVTADVQNVQGGTGISVVEAPAGTFTVSTNAPLIVNDSFDGISQAVTTVGQVNFTPIPTITVPVTVGSRYLLTFNGYFEAPVVPAGGGYATGLIRLSAGAGAGQNNFTSISGLPSIGNTLDSAIGFSGACVFTPAGLQDTIQFGVSTSNVNAGTNVLFAITGYSLTLLS